MPMVMASGRSGLEYKLRALLHCLWQALPPSTRMQSLLACCCSVQSFTTDMGTEMGLSEYVAPDLQSCLSTWMTGHTTANDEAVARDVMHCSLHCVHVDAACNNVTF
eukprot:15452913-Alexandrium_andersonii.AAC.1